MSSFWGRWSTSSSASSLRHSESGGQSNEHDQEKTLQSAAVASSPPSSGTSRRPSSESQLSSAHSAGAVSRSGFSTPRTSSDLTDDKLALAGRVSSLPSVWRSGSPALSRRTSIASMYSRNNDDRVWKTQDIGFNAISGVLNNPMQRSTSTGKISKADIPPVTPVPIRTIKTSDFDAYLKVISGVFEAYERNRAVGLSTVTEGLPRIPRRRTSKALDSPSASLMSLLEGQSRRRSSVRSLSLAGDGSFAPVRNAIASTAAPLDIVPSIFFEPDFNLENPSTFAAVVEQADVVNRYVASCRGLVELTGGIVASTYQRTRGVRGELLDAVY